MSASLDERTARVVRAFLEASPSALSVQEKLALDRAAARLLASGWELEDLVDAAAAYARGNGPPRELAAQLSRRRSARTYWLTDD